jgi:hypothetical protein
MVVGGSSRRVAGVELERRLAAAFDLQLAP